MDSIQVGETREIPLTQGKVAIVDAADYDFLMQWRWFAHREGDNWYARRAVRLAKDKTKTIAMHRIILNPAENMFVDHLDGNGLNNRRENLRQCTHQENQWNKGRQKNNTSGYIGVYWDKSAQKWSARIKNGGVSLFLGGFLSPEDAARAYNKVALDLRGEFAFINKGV